MSYREELRRFQAEYLNRLMAEAKGNLTRAAKLADVNRSHLRRWLKDHGLISRQTLVGRSLARALRTARNPPMDPPPPPTSTPG